MYTLKRVHSTNDETFGVLFNSAEIPVCLTLELPWRENKPNVSCIPVGLYHIIPHNTVKFPNTLELLNVRDRTGILIHIGNTRQDTKGCILVGRRWGFLNSQLAVLDSRLAMDALLKDRPQKILIT